MSDERSIDLYALLPEIYRLMDAERVETDPSDPEGLRRTSEPLRALLDVMSDQAEVVKRGVDAFLDDLFIETCDDWVIPYIGELVGNNALSGAARGRRVDVAKTIYYRRRKGILPMLEELARDVTGWGAHAVAFFELLGWTQNVNHLRFETTTDRAGRDPWGFDRVGTVNLRNLDAADRADGPFDVLAHTVDVRPGDRFTGWHNLKKIGFFLWRLASYPVRGVKARQSGDADHGWHFSPLGHPMPLFNNQRSESDPTGLAGEIHVPGPIRPRAFWTDLRDYADAEGATRPDDRPPFSDYVSAYLEDDGSSEVEAETALSIEADGRPVAPIEVFAADLSTWRRPPASVTGLRSGDLTGFSGLTSAERALNLRIGDVGPLEIALAAEPLTVSEARDRLEEAIHSVAESRELEGARVVVLDEPERLFLLPGVVGATIECSATATDTTTVTELGLDATAAVTVHGALSGDLREFPAFRSEEPSLAVRIGEKGPLTIALAPGATPAPENLDELRERLEEALRDAAVEWTGVRVGLVDRRVVAIAGESGQPMAIEPTDDDWTTVRELGLDNRVAVDVARGRMTFAVGAEPDAVRVHYHYGFSADMGGGPYDRTEALAESEGQEVIEVPPGQEDGLSLALAEWEGSTASRTVIEFSDSWTYRGPDPSGTPFLIDLSGRARPAFGSSPLSPFPTLDPGPHEIRVTIDCVGPVTAVLDDAPANIQEAAELLTGAIRDASPDDPLFADAKVEVLWDRLLVAAGGGRRIVMEDAPGDDAASRLGLTRAQSHPVLIGCSWSMLPALEDRDDRELLLTLGEEGPHRVRLAKTPETPQEAAVALQDGIREAASTLKFENTYVLLISEDRLLIVPGEPDAPPYFAPSANDATTLIDLGLESERRELILRARNRQRPTVLGDFAVSGGAGEARLGFEGLLISGQLRVGCELAAMSVVDTTLVPGGALDEQGWPREPEQASVVVPPESNERLEIRVERSIVGPLTVPDSVTRVCVLDSIVDAPAGSGESPVTPALAGNDDGSAPGPPLTIERSTVFGPVHVDELTLASETIFTERVVAVRRQSGCVRFSYVPDEESLTPRRYRCQPDLALLEATTESPDRVRIRVAPTFTSERYGTPAYAQLRSNCADEIRRGAADGSEMGAFCLLKQPQREADLRLRLEEYLPFGLDPVLIHVT